MENLREQILPFLASPSLDEGWLFILKIVFIILALFLVAFIIFSLSRTSWLKLMISQDMAEFFTYRPYGVRKIERAWNRIMGRLDTGLESEYKLAVIEADDMMNDILRRMGYGGETLSERISKLTSATIPNIEEVKEAHQIRNNIVHDPDYRLSLDDARRTLASYEQAFRDLQAI